MTDLTSLTLAEARERLRKKDITALELTDAHIGAVEAARALNAFVKETPDHARDMARASDARLAKGEGGPLEGIPLGIKDLFCTKGVRTTACSKILDEFTPTYESTVTANLWRDGAVMLGKLNNDEFAMGSSNETSCFGPVVNPWRRRGSNVGAGAGRSDRGRTSGAGRLVRRLGGGSCGTALPRRYGDGHRRLDPPARGIHRHGRPEADLRALLALGDRGVRLLARSGRADRAHRARHRDADALDGGARSEGHDVGRSAGAGLRGGTRPLGEGHAHRHPEGIPARRHAGRDRDAVATGHRVAEGCRRRDGRCLAAAHQVRAARLLHRGARGGVVKSRAL